MAKIVIPYDKRREGLYSIVDKINEALIKHNIKVVLWTPKSRGIKRPIYDDSRVYFEGERARDSRLDCITVPG